MSKKKEIIPPLNFAKFQEWYNSHFQVYASDAVFSRTLICFLNGNIEVRCKGETLYRGTQLYSAIEVYNDIPNIKNI